MLLLSETKATDSEGEKTETNSVTLSGLVLDNDTKEPLIGAKVEIQQPDNTTVYSDFNGSFEIKNLHPGNYTITVSYISFHDVILKDFLLTTDNQNIIIELIP